MTDQVAALAQRLRAAYWDSRVLPRGEGETDNWLAVAREAMAVLVPTGESPRSPEAAMTPDAATVAAIRARHGDCERHSGGPWTEGQALEAHADRATLLALLVRAGEANRRLQGTLAFHTGPHVTMSISYASELEGAQQRAERAEAEVAAWKGRQEATAILLAAREAEVARLRPALESIAETSMGGDGGGDATTGSPLPLLTIHEAVHVAKTALAGPDAEGTG